MTLPSLPPGWSWVAWPNGVGNAQPCALHEASGRATLRGSAGEVAAQAGRMERAIGETMEHGIPPEYLNQIVTGDAKSLAERIPDASVDLIFTDPVYDRIEDYAWLAETAARVLKPDSPCLVFTNSKWLPVVLDAVPTTNPVLTYSAEGGPAPMNGKIIAKAHHLVWYGGKKMIGYLPDNYRGANFGNSINHKWTKNPRYLMLVITAFTVPDAIVYDPFTGGGTVPAVCKMLSRQFIASEIDPATAERARERLATTQPPLPGLIVEQASLGLEAA